MKTLAYAGIGLLCAIPAAGQDRIARDFAGGYGQVEVGGPFAGAEFHGSRPLPSRMSFYEPAANSIDMSTDYWKRGESAPFDVAVRVNRGAPRRVGREAWPYTLSPHRVEFRRDEGALRWSSRYEFFQTLPGLVWTLSCENLASDSQRVELYVRCRTVVRTCQSFTWLDSAWTEYDQAGAVLAVHCDQPQTRQATFLFQNLGARPEEWTSSAGDLVPDSAGPPAFSPSFVLGGRTLARDTQGKPAAAFVYRKTLGASGRLEIRLAILSTSHSLWRATALGVRERWKKDAAAYDALVRRQIRLAPATGDRSVDATADWACALLAANAHSLEGRVVPMPCPAEYNFFFTHDVLLTDLSAVWFDAARVRRDLGTIASLAEHDVIPHARYWRDDGFKTELCTPDNWNHFWFIETVSRYLHHTRDTATVARLFPLLRKSLAEVLTQRHDDSLMYAFRPDWWDIGRREGPRSYTTVLAVRALRDYLFLASSMKQDIPLLPAYELLADGMQRALGSRLWDAAAGYLMNANEGAKDAHYYMGSLMGAVYGEIPPDSALRLLATARRVLVDDRLGVRNVMPPDFHLDSVRSYFRFPTNEAGDPYFYANGGVWPHANAWYAQGLVSAGNVTEALRFLRTTMTLDGVCASPRGQPAFYEYRFANSASPDYGAIDKPSFLWAGGMYLGTLYAIMGFREKEWNIGNGDGIAAGGFDTSSATVEFGTRRSARVTGTGARSVVVSAGGVESPSCVFPLDLPDRSPLVIRKGNAGDPCLTEVNAVVRSCRREKGGGLRAELSSFDGHRVTARIVSRHRSSGAFIDGRPVTDIHSAEAPDGAVIMTLSFTGTLRSQILVVR